MLEVKFYDHIEDELLDFAVILAKTDGKWVFCKHRERDTYEVPGGHREVGENILEAAKRELREETGAIDFTIEPICVYSVKGQTRTDQNKEKETFGMLFKADIFSFETELHNEIEHVLITEHLVENWTYPLIQPKLIEVAEDYFANHAAIARIRNMEQYLDDVLEAKKGSPDDFLNKPEIRERLRALSDYYDHGQWLEDYERDERGELPEGLKRGVLSQDALYNLLSEIEKR